MQILRDAGLDVIEGVAEAEVRRQLGVWVLAHHPHEPLRRARALLAAATPADVAAALAETYAVEATAAQEFVARAADSP